MVDQRDMAAIVGELEFFNGLDDETVSLLAGCAKNVRYNAGDYIFRESQPADTFYMLRHGTVALELHVPGRHPLVVESVAPGGMLGWSWIVPPYHWAFDARCNSLVRAIAFDGACLRGKMEDDHALGYELMRRFMTVLADRLNGTRLRLVDMYAPTNANAD